MSMSYINTYTPNGSLEQLAGFPLKNVLQFSIDRYRDSINFNNELSERKITAFKLN